MGQIILKSTIKEMWGLSSQPKKDPLSILRNGRDTEKKTNTGEYIMVEIIRPWMPNFQFGGLITILQD
jgi:hypothetical protein